MNLIPWRNKGQLPASRHDEPVARLRSEMDRLFERFFDDPWSLATGEEGGGGFMASAFSPAADVTETDKEIVVRLDVPGMDCGEIDVSVSGDLLTIAGEKKEQHEEEREGVHLSERSHGAFRRTLQLPAHIDSRNVTAECEKGVLTVRLPRSAEGQPRHIKVRRSS